jgi:hypothetical protein
MSSPQHLSLPCLSCPPPSTPPTPTLHPQFELIEPLRELFKDEVRALGRLLGVPEQFIARHPFPGGPSGSNQTRIKSNSLVFCSLESPGLLFCCFSQRLALAGAAQSSIGA